MKKDVNYNALIEGKYVAIVGPSTSLDGRGRGREIDSWDTVIRISGKAIPVPPTKYHDLGTRTDVVTENFWNFCPNQMPNLDVEAIMQSYIDSKAIIRCVRMDVGRFRKFEELSGGRVPISVAPGLAVLKEKMPASMIYNVPTKGILTVYDTALLKPKAIGIYGMSFSVRYDYRDEYQLHPFYHEPGIDREKRNRDLFERYQNGKTFEGHNYYAEIEALAHLIKLTDSLIHVDDALSQIMREVRAINYGKKV